MEEGRGQSYYGTAEYSDSFNGKAKETDFSANRIITHYMWQILSLCSENNIHVIVKNMPMNEASYAILTEDFKAHYAQYMEALQSWHETVIFDTDLTAYPNDYFGDADHLNPKGTQRFCRELTEQYQDLFKGK